MGKNYNNFKRGGYNNRGHNKSRGKPFSKSRNSSEFQKNKPFKIAPGAHANERSSPLTKVTIRENQVGITEFVSSGNGFTGVLKSRFSDFYVNEIDLDGTIADLNDFTIPSAKDPDYSISSEELAELQKEISDVVTVDLWTQIDEIAKGTRTEPLEIDVTSLDKDKRTAIHKVFKKLYLNKCNSCTINKDGDVKCIKVSQSDRKGPSRNKWLFSGEFVHFLVYKENMDTSEVAVIIANSLRLKPSQVNYCGTKDKRGRTTQKFCIKKRLPSQIVSAIRPISGVKVGNFTFHDKVVKLGELKGNRFQVALRHVAGDREEIEKTLQNVKELGFINYYGLQRFGNNAEIPTYKIGIALLKSDYKTACELILKPRENDLHFMRKVRETWWKNRDSKEAAAMFYNDKYIEKKLLNGLSEYGESDYANALRKIPRNMLLLYTHAYQSLVFNRIASKRFKQHGLKVLVGDLVYRNKDELDELVMNTENEMPAPDAEENANENDDEVVQQKETESAYKQSVKALTEDDISSAKYNIFDIVLPLPGHDITYPSNELQQWYEDILAEEDLTSEKLKHGVKTYSLAGAYRKLLIKPQNMSWYFKRYNSPEEDLIPPRFDKKSEKKEAPQTGEGNFEGLVLDFCLPPSAYATMFLREILKSDTSSSNQAQMGKDEMKKYEEKNNSKVAEDNSTKGEEKIENDNDEGLFNEKTAEKRPIEDDDQCDAKRSKQEIESQTSNLIK